MFGPPAAAVAAEHLALSPVSGISAMLAALDAAMENTPVYARAAQAKRRNVAVFAEDGANSTPDIGIPILAFS